MARKNFKRRRVIIKNLNDLLQADLAEIQPYAELNRGFCYILVVINVFSEFVWIEPVKRKTAEGVKNAMKNFLLTMEKTPKILQTDLGKDFYSKHFKMLMQSFGINLYSKFSTPKATVVERVNRTLKNLMCKTFSIQGTYKWLNILPRLVGVYNNRKHSTKGIKSIEINERNSENHFKCS